MSHYIIKEVSKVDAKDSKVCLLGKVKSSNENSFVLDDGTGKIEIFSDNKLEEKKLIRVFCSVENEKLKADIIQDMDNLDFDLFRKVKELYNKAGV